MGRGGQARVIWALLAANMRFWPTVAPVMWRELSRWRAVAAEIGDPALAALATEKLSSEAFNAEVAATLATLAPRRERARAVRAIVALEVLFDYLDGRSELGANSGVPLADSLRLFGALTDAVGGGSWAPLPSDPDGSYLAALAERVREQAGGLPSFALVQPLALAAGERCGQAQSRLHQPGRDGRRTLEAWARDASADSGLGWREYTAGCASSVLAMHALIAAGASTGTTVGEAERIDAAYLATCAVITTLDSVVDEAEDTAAGEPGFIRLFDGREQVRASAVATLGEALRRIACAPCAAHHQMTLAGVAAYYTTHPGAGEPQWRELRRDTRRTLAPGIWPTLAVMVAWRAAKAARLAGTARTRPRLRVDGARAGGSDVE